MRTYVCMRIRVYAYTHLHMYARITYHTYTRIDHHHATYMHVRVGTDTGMHTGWLGWPQESI